MSSAFAQTGANDIEANHLPNLVRAVMCEGVSGNDPVTPAIVFSIRRGKVFCLSEFSRIQAPMPVFHKWYRRDVLNTTLSLTLQADRWATYSSINLRESDRGPWRVEITDSRGNIFMTLYFSIVD